MLGWALTNNENALEAKRLLRVLSSYSVVLSVNSKTGIGWTATQKEEKGKPVCLVCPFFNKKHVICDWFCIWHALKRK